MVERRERLTIAGAGGRARPSALVRYRPDNGAAVEADAAAAATVMEEPTAQPQQSEAFYNWRQQWYPVHYAQDLPEGEPQRVWLFDEAIVIARRPGSVHDSPCTALLHLALLHFIFAAIPGD